ERVSETSIWWPKSALMKGEIEPGVVVAGLQAPLSFLNAYQFRADMRDLRRSHPEQVHLFVLEATGIVQIDFTAAQVLIQIIRESPRQEMLFAIARLDPGRAQEALPRFPVHDVLDPARIFRSVEEAIRALGPRAKPGKPQTKS